MADSPCISVLCRCPDMSTQIDPVTGLPMYVPPPLEQIPFKNPPYPWNDLTNNPVTPRTTYYGDDSIPTVSTIAGMHPTELGGQTVNTDGNHALLVSNVGGSGGGTPSPTNIGSVGDIPMDTSDMDIWDQLIQWQTVTKILHMDFWAYATGALDTSENPDVFFELAAADGETGKGFFARVLVGNGRSGMTTGLPNGFYSVDFGGGLDVGAYLGTNAPGFWVHTSNKVNPIRYGFTVYAI